MVTLAMCDAVAALSYLFCDYRTAQNFGRRKLWQSWNCKKIGGENFGGLAMNCQIHQSLAVGWRIKLWRIGNEPPNPPKFCAVRYS